MKASLVIIVLAVSSIACSGATHVVKPQDGGVLWVQETNRDLSALGQTTTSVREGTCGSHEKTLDAHGRDEYKYWDCKWQRAVIFATQGWFVSLWQPAAIAGGMVGAGYLIGDGLSKSGSTMNQTNAGGQGMSSVTNTNTVSGTVQGHHNK